MQSNICDCPVCTTEAFYTSCPPNWGTNEAKRRGWKPMLAHQRPGAGADRLRKQLDGASGRVAILPLRVQTRLAEVSAGSEWHPSERCASPTTDSFSSRQPPSVDGTCPRIRSLHLSNHELRSVSVAVLRLFSFLDTYATTSPHHTFTSLPAKVCSSLLHAGCLRGNVSFAPGERSMR